MKQKARKCVWLCIGLSKSIRKPTQTNKSTETGQNRIKPTFFGSVLVLYIFSVFVGFSIWLVTHCTQAWAQIGPIWPKNVFFLFNLSLFMMANKVIPKFIFKPNNVISITKANNKNPTIKIQQLNKITIRQYLKLKQKRLNIKPQSIK